MRDAIFRVMLDLYMVSDPWPLSREQDLILRTRLSEEAKERGYNGWVEAYHEFGRKRNEPV